MGYRRKNSRGMKGRRTFKRTARRMSSLNNVPRGGFRL